MGLQMHGQHDLSQLLILAFGVQAYDILVSTTLEPHHEKTDYCLCKNKSADQLRSNCTFVFATQLVQFLFFLNPNFQAISLFLRLYRLVCVGPGRKRQRLVFSRRGSFGSLVSRKVACSLLSQHYMSCMMGKSGLCLCKTKTQISNCTGDQRLCFRYTDSIIPLLLKFQISSF